MAAKSGKKDGRIAPAFQDETALHTGNADIAPDLMSDAEYQAAFRKIAADYLDGKEAQETPALLYITGLPGAGKSTFVQSAREQQPKLENYVHINFDDLRAYHPRYAAHVKRDAVNAAARIDKAVEGLIGWLTEEAAARRVNVILDDAAMGQEMTRMILFPFRANGYDISAVAIAVPSVIARQAVHLRFEENHAAARQGQDVLPRWVNKEEQDNAPAALVETVETIENEKLADRFVIIDRQQNLLYAAGKQPGRDAGTVVKAQQQRPLDADETAIYQNNAVMIAALMQARENAPAADAPATQPVAPQQKAARKRALRK